jgi:hypothetical protein
MMPILPATNQLTFCIFPFIEFYGKLLSTWTCIFPLGVTGFMQM